MMWKRKHNGPFSVYQSVVWYRLHATANIANKLVTYKTLTCNSHGYRPLIALLPKIGAHKNSEHKVSYDATFWFLSAPILKKIGSLLNRLVSWFLWDTLLRIKILVFNHFISFGEGGEEYLQMSWQWRFPLSAYFVSESSVWISVKCSFVETWKWFYSH
jgi:hypothetical protein